MSNAKEVLERLKRLNPKRRFVLADSGNAIGVWSEKAKKYETCSVMTIVDEKWTGYIGPEIKANGKRVYTYRKATKK
jgi:hypothetical protein